MNGNHNSGQVISGLDVPEGGGRPGWTGLLVAVALVFVVGGFAFSRGYSPRSFPTTTGLPVSVSPSTSRTTTSSVTVVETLEPVDAIAFDWMNEVVDLAIAWDTEVYAVAPGGVARLGGGEWMSINVEDLPVGTPGDGWPGRYITQAAAAGDGSLWVAGHATSHADDEEFGGIVDGWTGGRTLEWIASYHCPLCGLWTVWTTNDVPELSAGIGDLAVSGDGIVYASVGEDLLMVFDGYQEAGFSEWKSYGEWKSFRVPLPTGSSGVSSPWSSSLAVSTNGVLWAGTNSHSGGVLRFDGAGFSRYTTEDGLPSDRELRVSAAADGTIWAATERSGIASFDGTSWTSYTTADGLLSNQAVIATGSDGTVWAVHLDDPPYGYSRFDGIGWTTYPFDFEVGGYRAEVAPDGTLWTISDDGLISFDGNTRTIYPTPFVQPDGSLTFTPVQWGITPDDQGPGTHTVLMIVDVRPLTIELVEDVSGRLIWDQTVVDLCGINIRREGDGFLHIGDIFQTTEGCGSNPTAMQDAFDESGLPETACLTVRFGRVDHEYCAPLR